MLQVRGLAVDVVARRMLADASFTVAAGDKVGLVGRNGAGKTSLLRVLAGEDDPAEGVILRRGTLGYVPQNPRPRAEAEATALTHVLSGKCLDRAATRLAEMHKARDRPLGRDDRKVLRGRGALPARGRLLRRVRGEADRDGARPAPGPRRPCPRRAVGWREASGRAGARAVRRGRPAS